MFVGGVVACHIVTVSRSYLLGSLRSMPYTTLSFAYRACLLPLSPPAHSSLTCLDAAQNLPPTNKH